MKKIALFGAIIVALLVSSATFFVKAQELARPTPLARPSIIEQLPVLPTITPVPPAAFIPDEHKIWLLVQDWRESVGKRQYDESWFLCKYASRRAEEIKLDWSHGGMKAISDEIYKTSKFVGIGENLAKDMWSNQAYLDAWLLSPEHKRNLVENYTESCLRCSGTYCVQLFGKY